MQFRRNCSLSSAQVTNLLAFSKKRQPLCEASSFAGNSNFVRGSFACRRFVRVFTGYKSSICQQFRRNCSGFAQVFKESTTFRLLARTTFGCLGTYAANPRLTQKTYFNVPKGRALNKFQANGSEALLRNPEVT